MTVTQMQYTTAKEMFEEVQRLPTEAQDTILKMLHGAIAISDMYTRQRLTAQAPEERPST